MEQKDFSAFYDEHAAYAATFRAIVPSSYATFGVKRGLRNEDGTGVVVGLTEIGDVHGYILDERERIPVEGRLRYRGINVSDIVAGFQAERRFGFEETVYLLLFGRLPDAAQLAQFQAVLGDARNLPTGYAEDIVLRQPSSDIMNKLARAVLAAYSHDKTPEDYTTRNLLRQSIELVARFPALVAYCYQSKRRFIDNESLHIHSAKENLSTAENLLMMVRPHGDYSEVEAEIIDLSLVLHAEHGGGNNSSFTVRVVSSAYTDTYSAIAAAIGSLKGTRHGGANNRVMSMMADIQANVAHWENEGEVRDYLAKLIRGQAGDGSGLVYGMGHAIYTVSDPRAVLLRQKADQLVKSKGDAFARELALYDTIARLTPEVFAEVKKNTKVIAPNVDFYSGLVYKMLGIPPELYTPIFAVSRVAGWCAHRIEELSGESRIIRPAYKNVLGKQDYLPLAER